MMTEPNTPDDAAIALKLEELRGRLTAEIWSVATQAAITSDHERVRDLVKLKVDTEAIDFALAHRPKFSTNDA